ncbi:MAG: RNA repair transcriptional activator RtcR family protein, partial [Myxococcota bacterium]
MKTVLIGFYGTTLDFAGAGPARWKKWRPTLSLFQREELLIDRLELLRPSSNRAHVLRDDIRRASPDTRIAEHDFDVADPWDFESVYAALFDFARAYDFREDTRYLVHLTTGTHVAQICLFLLTEARFIPAELVQSSPREPGVSVVNLDLSQYDAITQRFDAEREARQRQLSLGIETKSPRWAQLIQQVEEVAHRSQAPILLDGATGVGKTHLARRIHALKARTGQVSGELVEVNCATLRGDQAMSTLFGHR